MPTHRIDGFDIHFVQGGPRDAPKRVLYVHGTGCNARVWERHCQALPSDCQYICVDLAGHGRSGGAGFRGTADHAFVIESLADGLGWERFVIVGHSLGGAIALTYAVYHPARLAAMVLVDTGGRLRVAPEVLESARLAAAGAEVPPLDRRWTFSPSTPDTVIDRVYRDLGDVSPELVYRDWIADDSFDFLSRLGAVRTPCLAVCGADDPITPVRNHTFFQGSMPSCELAILEDCGHWPLYEQPDAFDRIVVDYVDGVYDSARDID